MITNTIKELRGSEDFEFKRGNPCDAMSASSKNRNDTVANLTYRGFVYYGPKTEVKRFKSFREEQPGSPNVVKEVPRKFNFDS
jgi:hypothetical protein